MKKYYPVSLDITGKKCVIVGGGTVAERKAERLLECGARVTVVSRSLTLPLEGRIKAGEIDHIDADYDKKALHGVVLVIGATDREDVNGQISKDALSMGLLVNIVDDPGRCNFILPALVQQGDLSIAISTGGRSPALARKLREDLQQQYGPEYQILLGIMGSLREEILNRGYAPQDNKVVFENIVHSEILQAIRNRDRLRVKKIIYDFSGIDMDVTL